MRWALIESPIFAVNLLFILASYIDRLKITSIGKGIAAMVFSEISAVKGENLKNFDQWTEELSRQVVIQSDEQDLKATGKVKEIFNDDDSEEEE